MSHVVVHARVHYLGLIMMSALVSAVVIPLTSAQPAPIVTQIQYAPDPPQDKPPAFLATATDTSAYLLVLDAHPEMAGFFVYRAQRADLDPVLLNTAPVGPVTDPALARAILGDDFEWIARALRVQDAFDILMRLRADPGAATAVSLASLRAAVLAGRLFEDNNVETGEQYRYRVDMVDLDGEVLRSEELEILIRARRPESPHAVRGEAGDSNVRITWDYAPFVGDPKDVVVGFHIYRQADGVFERMQKPPVLRQEDVNYRVDTSVGNAETYSYYVTAVDFIGRESEPSLTVSATPQDLTPPRFPQNVEVFGHANAALVTWDMNLELDLSHYDVFRSLELEEGYEQINPVPIPVDQTRYLDEGLRSGLVYHYKVRAVDYAGNASDFSNAAAGQPIDTNPPAAPEDLSIVLKDRKATLTWVAPSDPDLRGYRIYRKSDGQKHRPLNAQTVPRDTTRFIDQGYDGRGLTPGQAYTYAVTAVDEAFNESDSAMAAVIVPDDQPPEPPVASYVGSTAKGHVEIHWQPSLDFDVVGYRIYRGLGDEAPSPLLTVEGKRYAAVDSTVRAGREYIYQVVAVDAAGNESEKTKPTRVIPRDLVIPPAPLNVQAKADAEGVIVSWDSVQADDLVGYFVYRLETPYGDARRLNSEPLRQSEFRDYEGMAGQYYRVSSLDASGHENMRGLLVEAQGEAGSL